MQLGVQARLGRGRIHAGLEIGMLCVLALAWVGHAGLAAPTDAPLLSPAAWSPFPVGVAGGANGAVAMALGDLDGDGDDDLVVASTFSSNVLVLLTQADASLISANPAVVNLVGFPADLALVDINGDQRLDLVTVSHSPATLAIRLGDGHGGFGRAKRWPTEPYIDQLLSADLNSDTRPDLVVIVGTTMQTFINRGQLQFEVSDPVSLSDTSTRLVGAALKDINADGRPDLTAVFSGPSNLVWRLGDGQGGFVGGGTRSLDGFVAASTMADFNSDGLEDIAITRNSGVNLMVFLADPATGFGNDPSFATTVNGGLRTVHAVDLDADGHPDIIAASSNSTSSTHQQLQILRGVGDGTFIEQPAAELGFAGPIRALVSGRLDADARPDLVLLNFDETLYPLLGQGLNAPQSTPQQRVALQHAPLLSPAVDTDGDGIFDLIIFNAAADELSTMRGDGAGGFAPERVIYRPTAGFLGGLALQDLNADGHVDIVASSYVSKPDFSQESHLVTLLGNAQGGFTEMPGNPVTLPGIVGRLSLPRAEANEPSDLIFGDANGLNMLRGTGDGHFDNTATPLADAQGQIRATALADVNADGREDLLVLRAVLDGSGNANNQSELIVLLAEAGGGFTPGPDSPLQITGTPAPILAADMNGDGLLDIVTQAGGSTTIFTGNGLGGFVAVEFSVPSLDAAVTSMGAADLDGDGDQDLLFTLDYAQMYYDVPESIFHAINTRPFQLATMLNDGSGIFSTAPGMPLPVGKSPSSMAIADFNGDQTPDVAVSNGFSDSISVLLGKPPALFQQRGALAGAWFSPLRNGEGLLLDAYAGGGLFLTWFTYARDGSQRWLTALAPQWPADFGVPAHMPVMSWRGPEFNAFDPADLQSTPWGDLQLTFTDCEHATLDFQALSTTSVASINSGRIELERLSPAAPLPERCRQANAVTTLAVQRSNALTDAPSAANAGLSGAWFDPARNGEGLLFEVLGEHVLFATWFTYDNDGNAIWLTATTANWSGQFGDAVTMDALQWSGPKFFNFDPTQLVSSHWGSLTLEFSDCNHASLSYQSDQGASSGTLSLQRLVAGGLEGVPCVGVASVH